VNLRLQDLNRVYLEEGNLSVEVMGRGTAWLDTGSHENLASATDFRESNRATPGTEDRLSWKKSLSTKAGCRLAELEKAVFAHGSSSYGKYLQSILHKSQKI
jgi:glucose-1-phosphate thymidylyltransferase